MMILAHREARQDGTAADSVIVSIQDFGRTGRSANRIRPQAPQAPDIGIDDMVAAARIEPLCDAARMLSRIAAEINIHALKRWVDLPPRGMGIDSSERDRFEAAAGMMLTGFQAFQQETRDAQTRLAELDRALSGLDALVMRLEEAVEGMTERSNRNALGAGEAESLQATIAAEARNRSLLRHLSQDREMLAGKVMRFQRLVGLVIPRWQQGVARLIASQPGEDRAVAGSVFAEAHCDLVWLIDQEC